MKSPDEIKKGLADNIAVHYHPGDHEPRLAPLMMIDLEELHADALAYIQRLEEDKEELLEKVEQLEEDIKNIREGNPVGAVALVGRELPARFQAQNKQLQAERDAAVKDLSECYASHCPYCKNWDKPGRAVVCINCRNGAPKCKQHFEWRGVQKEE